MRLPLAALALALCHPATSTADTVTLLPAEDTGLLAGSPEAEYNFGLQRHVSIGATGNGNGAVPSRGLFRFDLAAAIPAGSTIQSARFELTVERAPGANGGGTAQTSSFELHRMLVPWIEGTKFNNDMPGGAAAGVGEPTWNDRAAPSTTWGQAGGEAGIDYAALASGSTSVVAGDGKGDTYTWTLNATGLADAQAMLDTPGTNFGWLLKTVAEGTPKTARRFYLKDTLDDPSPTRRGKPPELIVDFSPPVPLAPPEVTAFSYDGTDIDLQFLALAGLSYAVQTNTGLEEAGWATVETLDPIVDGILSSTVPTAAAARSFVRILVTDD